MTEIPKFNAIYRVPSGHSFAIGIAVVGPILLASLPLRAAIDGVPQLLLAPYYLVALAVAAVAINATRVSVRISSQGVQVINPIRVTELPWAEIDRFVFGFPEGWMIEHCAVIESRAGKRIPIAGVTDRTYLQHQTGTPAHQILDELQRAHKVAMDRGGELPEDLIVVSGADRVWQPVK